MYSLHYNYKSKIKLQFIASYYDIYDVRKNIKLIDITVRVQIQIYIYSC